MRRGLIDSTETPPFLDSVHGQDPDLVASVRRLHPQRAWSLSRLLRYRRAKVVSVSREPPHRYPLTIQR